MAGIDFSSALNRKYDILGQQANAATTTANADARYKDALGPAQAAEHNAQAKLFGTNANLAPGLAGSEIGQRNAQAGMLNSETDKNNYLMSPAHEGALAQYFASQGHNFANGSFYNPGTPGGTPGATPAAPGAGMPPGVTQTPAGRSNVFSFDKPVTGGGSSFSVLDPNDPSVLARAAGDSNVGTPPNQGAPVFNQPWAGHPGPSQTPDLDLGNGGGRGFNFKPDTRTPAQHPGGNTPTVPGSAAGMVNVGAPQFAGYQSTGGNITDRATGQAQGTPGFQEMNHVITDRSDGSIAAAPGRAAGDAQVGGMPEPSNFKKGTGKVPGKGDGKTDTQLSMLAPGEAVLNKAAAEHLGRDTIDLLNAAGAHKMGLSQQPNEPAAVPVSQAQNDKVQGNAAGNSNFGKKGPPAGKPAAKGKPDDKKGPPAKADGKDKAPPAKGKAPAAKAGPAKSAGGGGVSPAMIAALAGMMGQGQTGGMPGAAPMGPPPGAGPMGPAAGAPMPAPMPGRVPQ